MADGRSFGLLPYLQAGDLNGQIMRQLGVQDNATYRQALAANGLELSRQFFKATTASDIDQGCCGTVPIEAPCPSNYPA